MIDHLTETLVNFQHAGKHIPGNPALCTRHRWRLHGVRGVKLETLLVGGIRYTSIEAISRFIEEQNTDQAPTPAISPSQRRTMAEAANRVLEEAGL